MKSKHFTSGINWGSFVEGKELFRKLCARAKALGRSASSHVRQLVMEDVSSNDKSNRTRHR